MLMSNRMNWNFRFPASVLPPIFRNKALDTTEFVSLWFGSGVWLGCAKQKQHGFRAKQQTCNHKVPDLCGWCQRNIGHQDAQCDLETGQSSHDTSPANQNSLLKEFGPQLYYDQNGSCKHDKG